MEVGALVKAARVVLDDESVRRFARRALGPHGAVVPVKSLAFEDGSAEAYADRAAEALSAGLIEGWALAVAVGLGDDGSTVALCVERSGPQGPGEQADERAAEQERHGADAAGQERPEGSQGQCPG